MEDIFWIKLCCRVLLGVMIMNKYNTSLLAAVFAKAADKKNMTRGNAGIVIYARDIKKILFM